jgi:hypothetical protein
MNRAISLRFGLVLALAAPSFFVEGCKSQSGTSASGDVGVSSILFIKRVTTTVSNGVVNIDVAGGNGQVIDYSRYEPGGSLNILSPARPDGTVTNLTSAFSTADFNGADVSFDGTEAVFSMKKTSDDHYHIYTVQLSPGAGGKYELHQKTAGDYDDINPFFMPGGLIGFVTNEMYTNMGTRADEYEHSRVVVQLATISESGGDAQRRLFPQSLSHTVAPSLRHDGKIMYSRWEHLGPTNDVKMFAANPDGTQMIAVSGQHGKPCNSLFSVKETLTPNVMIGIGTDRERTIHAGALVQIDARNRADSVCMTGSAAQQQGHACLDEEHAQFTVLTPGVPLGSDPSPVGRYREPSVLPDGRILTSWAPGPVNDLNEQAATPPDFGIYVYDPSTQQNQLVYNDRQYWDLNAIAIAPRSEPPVIGSLQAAQDSSQAVHIGSVNVTNTSLQETVNGAEFNNTPLTQALSQGAVAVRVIEGFSSESAKGVSMFGLTMHEGAAVLGETKVYPDGSWLADIPPYIPVHLQPIDKFGLSIRSQGLWIQGAPGEDRRCVGCHESRTGQGVSAFGQNPTVAEQTGADNLMVPVMDRVANGEYGWNVKVQPILTKDCAGCHNSSTTTYYQITRSDPVTGKVTTYNIPYLDLSDTPVTAYYDKMVAVYPASYVSIFYPASMMVDMNTTVTGKVPPMWGVPANARGSALIEKINLHAADGTTAWPLSTHPMHPEDVGGSMSDAERKVMVLTDDLGGQYWARDNTGFAPFASGSDPVAPTSQQ